MLLCCPYKNSFSKKCLQIKITNGLGGKVEDCKTSTAAQMRPTPLFNPYRIFSFLLQKQLIIQLKQYATATKNTIGLICQVINNNKQKSQALL
jgi:hypothetical protein